MNVEFYIDWWTPFLKQQNNQVFRARFLENKGKGNHHLYLYGMKTGKMMYLIEFKDGYGDSYVTVRHMDGSDCPIMFIDGESALSYCIGRSSKTCYIV